LSAASELTPEAAEFREITIPVDYLAGYGALSIGCVLIVLSFYPDGVGFGSEGFLYGEGVGFGSDGFL
jgi:hypothetical protein